MRDKDYLRKEEAAVNRMIEALSARIVEIEDQADALQARVGRLRVALDASPDAEARMQVETLDEDADRLCSALRQFKTRRDEAIAVPEPATAGAWSTRIAWRTGITQARKAASRHFP